MLGTNKAVDDYEIDPGQLKLGVEIGKGAFGRVHLATVDNLPGQSGPILVAVKQIKSNYRSIPFCFKVMGSNFVFSQRKLG